MEIILLAIFIAIFLGMAALNKQIAYIGIVGGVGLIILGLMVAGTSIQMQTGLTQNTVGPSYVINFVYGNIETVYPSAAIMQWVVSIILGGAGLLVFIVSATSGRL